jgi:hypothetical protein
VNATVIPAQPVIIPGACDRYGPIIARYIADPSARLTPLPRAAAHWYVFKATWDERQHILWVADQLTPTLVLRHWDGGDPVVGQVLRNDDWQVTVSPRWDTSTTTSPDRDTVTVTLRRRP